MSDERKRPAPLARVIRAPEVKAASGERGKLLRREFAFDVKAVDDLGAIEGYGSVFGVEDSYGDIVAPGSFVASLAAHKAAGTMPAFLWQHDPADPIGVWTDMVEDAKGLRVKGRLLGLNTDIGRYRYEQVKGGALRGLSIGFMAKQSFYDRETEIRTLSEIDLWEVSIVTFGANPAALTDSVKSASVDEINKPSDAERWLREVAPNVSKSEATAFVSCLLRMGGDRREAVITTERALKAAEKLQLALST